MRIVPALFLAMAMATSLAAAQGPSAKAPKQQARTAATAEPQAISGLASSGRNCIAPDRVSRSSYWADDDGGGNLEPLINFTTSFSGTLVLHVSKYSAERSAGCYFYKVEIITG